MNDTDLKSLSAEAAAVSLADEYEDLVERINAVLACDPAVQPIEAQLIRDTAERRLEEKRAAQVAANARVAMRTAAIATHEVERRRRRINRFGWLLAAVMTAALFTALAVWS